MRIHEVEPASYYYFWGPLFALALLLASAIFYITRARLGSDRAFGIGVSVIVAMSWLGQSVVLRLMATKGSLPEEFAMSVYAGIIFITLLGLTIWQFQLRLALAIPVAALSSSLWLLAVWLATARNYLR